MVIVSGKGAKRDFKRNGDFRVVLVTQCRLRIRQKCFSLYGEYAESI